MGKGSSVGLLLLVVGIILLIAYGVYLGFDEILEAADTIVGAIVGLIILGLIVLIASIVMEQRRDTKKTKDKIKKEDLEP
jgi:hypothetical protein